MTTPSFERRSIRYGIAVTAMALAALLRWALPEVLSPAPYLAFYPAVIVAAALGGVGPGLLATFGSWLFVNLVFGQFELADYGLQMRSVIWIVGSTGLSLLAGRLGDARRRVERFSAELAERVAAQTAEIRAANATLEERVAERTSELQRSRQAALNLARDATAARAAAEQAGETFFELIERAPFGVYVVDSQFRIAVMNAGSQTGAFRNVRPLIGRNLAEAMRILWPEPVAAEIIAHFRHTLDTDEPYHSARFTSPRQDVGVVESYEWELHRMTLPDGQYGVICYYYDTTKLHEAEAQLRLQSAALESAANAIAIVNRSGAIEWVNDAFSRLTGYSLVEARGQSPRVLKSGQHPPEFYKGMWDTVLAGRVWHNELINKRKDGTLYPEEMTITPVHGADGTITHLIAIKQDITERKVAEEALMASLHEKEVLLREIHHRVKNNLQVIASLVDLQTNALADPALRGIFQEVRNRVRSMALVHEKLYQSESLAWVDFADYVSSLLSYLARSHRRPGCAIQVKTDLQPVSLSVEQAVPSGLILNELVSNAFKHAFDGRSEGEVRTTVSTCPDGRVRLRVSDNGVGLPNGMDWRQAHSLGLRLIQLLAGQLRATVQVRTGAGTEFEIAFEPEKAEKGDASD